MEESVDKGPELLSLKGSDEILRIIRDIGRISVRGFDIRLPREDVVSALRTHFASCGKITDVYIGIDYHEDNTLESRALIYFLGEGAVDKALLLNGSDVRGWKISVRDIPFSKHANHMAALGVEGYDTSLSQNEIKSALIKLFSPYGEITRVLISDGSAVVFLYGEDAAVKAPELSGSDMGGRKVVVRLLSELGKTTVHSRPRHGPYCGRYCTRKHYYPGKKAKTSAE